MTKKVVLSVTVFLVLVCAADTSVLLARAQIIRRWSLHVVSLPFEQINARAIRVFQGVAVEVRSLEGDVQEVDFLVSDVFRGNIKNGELLTIRQYVPLSPSVDEGDEVLWYLPEDTNSEHLVSPIGLLSGAFRVIDDPNNLGKKLAVNPLNNEGLCSSECGQERGPVPLDLLVRITRASPVWK